MKEQTAPNMRLLLVKVEGVPEELRVRPQWVLWKAVGDKPDKVPYSARTGHRASRCLLRGLTVQRWPSDPSTKGTSDGPPPAYPLARPPGRGSERALLPYRRRLCPAQSPRRSTLRGNKAT